MKKRKWMLPWICVSCLITGIFLSFYDTYFYTNKGQLDSLAICFSKKIRIREFVFFAFWLPYLSMESIHCGENMHGVQVSF